jgi:hypothetical protein
MSQRLPFLTFKQCALALALCIPLASQAATFTVTTTVDEPFDGTETTALPDGTGLSLREALGLSDALAGQDTVDFDAALDGATFTLALGELAIGDSVIIVGSATPQTIDAAGLSRVINVGPSLSFNLSNVNLTNGNAGTATDGSSDGGGILLQTTTAAALTNVSITGCSAFSGGAIDVNAFADINVTDSSFSNNSAIRAGGAIEHNGGTTNVTLTNVSGINNSTGATPGNGGFMHVTGAGRTFVNGGNFQNNTAAREGGAFWNDSGVMTLSGAVIIDGNTASGPALDDGGGGLFQNPAGTLVIGAGAQITNNIADGALGSGGGILNLSNLQVTGATISGNRANRAGGGIEAIAGTSTTLTNVTLNNNNAGVAPAVAAPGNGGGMHITGNGNLTLSGGTVNGNVAALEGGGLWNGSGLMAISGAAIIDGNTASGPAADDGGGGIFQNTGGTLTISGSVSIVNNVADGAAGSGGGIHSLATVEVTGSEIADNRANRAGGGIEAASGASTTLTNVTLSDNNAGVAPAVAAPGNGGGMHVTGAGPTSIVGGTISGNVAAREGGGLWNDSGLMALTGPVLIDANIASGPAADDGGGGIFQNPAGSLTIGTGAQITDNIADGALGSGGGILNLSSVQVTGATISGNRANRAGGGIEAAAGTTTTLTNVTLNNNNAGVAPAVAAPGNGGGMHITGNGGLTLSGGTVSGNVAALEGGGLWNGSGLMTVNGGAVIDGNTASGPAADDGGGGIFQNGGGTLAVSGGVQITNNVADGASGSGGGILNLSIVEVTGSTITGNIANRAGGGIEAIAGTSTTLTNVTLNNNNAGVAPAVAAPGNGGGMHITGNGGLTLSGGTVNGNVAALEGGGLWNGSGLMAISGGTFIRSNTASGPAADDGGGGIFQNTGGTLTVSGGVRIDFNVADGALGSGGGIHNLSIANITNSTIGGNRANRAGGGIEAAGGATTTLTDVSVTGNNAGVAPAVAAPGNGGGLHVSGAGSTTISGGGFGDNIAAREGGGIWNDTGLMVLTDAVQIVENTASGPGADDGGGGVFQNTGGTLSVSGGTQINDNIADGAAGSGGGILSLATIDLTDVSISGNRANRAGGGIEAAAGTSTTLTNVSMTGNNAGLAPAVASPGNGGALHITGNGNLTYTGGSVTDNTAALEGGGLWNGSGQMTLSGLVISNNSAAGPAADDGGGGLFNNGGTLSVTQSEISGNSATGASGSGGGILNNTGGALSVVGGSITGNSAPRAGGGIEDNAGASTSLTGVTVDGNSTGSSPGNGGGLHVTGAGSINVDSSTFSGNDAANEGGGLWNSAAASMLINTSTVSGNSSPAGGGVFQDGTGGTMTVASSTIANNSGTGLTSEGGSITLGNTIISSNTGAACAGAGAIGSAGFNLLNNTAGCTFNSMGTDAVGLGAQLGPLADNGGDTLTHLPGPTSPVLDAGSCTAGVDQRGVARPIDLPAANNAANGCDIGSVEATEGTGITGSIALPIPTTGFWSLAALFALLGVLSVLALRPRMS